MGVKPGVDSFGTKLQSGNLESICTRVLMIMSSCGSPGTVLSFAYPRTRFTAESTAASAFSEPLPFIDATKVVLNVATTRFTASFITGLAGGDGGGAGDWFGG